MGENEREGKTTQKNAVKKIHFYNVVLISGGAVASWLVHSIPDRVVRVRALAGVTVLCS